MNNNSKLSTAVLFKGILDILWYVSIIILAVKMVIFGIAFINPDADYEDAYIKVPCKITAPDIPKRSGINNIKELV